MTTKAELIESLLEQVECLMEEIDDFNDKHHEFDQTKSLLHDMLDELDSIREI